MAKHSHFWQREHYLFVRRLLSRFSFKAIAIRLLQLNHHVFPHIYVIANVLLTIELGTYRGFTARYMSLDSRVLMFVAVISFSLIFIENLRQKIVLPRLTVLVLELNKLALLPLIVVNYLLVSLDVSYYPNYVYAHFHINVNNMQLILSLNVIIFVLQLLQQSKSVARFVWQRLNLRSGLNILFLLAVASFVLPNVQLISQWMYQAGSRVMHTIDFSWDERFIYLNGGEKSTGWITHYTQFINKHVAERGVIFIPPQKESWQMEGNPYYLRWFIYPRFTVQSQDLVAPIPDEAEYVLIDNGAWPGMNEYGWPRMFIPADKIEKMIFIDRDTLQETVITGQDYRPEIMAYKWGVIQLKK